MFGFIDNGRSYRAGVNEGRVRGGGGGAPAVREGPAGVWEITGAGAGAVPGEEEEVVVMEA
jgi:hypothetical protein